MSVASPQPKGRPIEGPLTTVVIPAYNAAQFLQRTLDSALSQTYRNLEVIVVDDGSLDQTGEIARQTARADDRVRVLSVPNGGVASARNIGIDQASGPYIAFLDADDLWHPTKIERQVQILESGIAACVYVSSRHIDTEDRVIGQYAPDTFSGYSFARHLYAKPVGNGSSLLVRREAARAVGGFDVKQRAWGLEGSEDLDFELRLAAQFPMASIHACLVGYRRWPGSMSTDTPRMARSAIATIQEHLDNHPELPRFASRLAVASTLEFAVNTLRSDGQWALALPYLARLLRTDALRGLSMLREIYVQVTRDATSVPPVAESPGFYDVDPEPQSLNGSSTPARARRSRQQRLLAKLEQIDAALAARLERPNVTSEPDPE